MPVERSALQDLAAAAERAGERGAAERRALGALLDLADDLRAEAVRRLRERGASEAQVDRYEDAFATQARAAREAGRALDEALMDLRRRAAGLAES